MLSPLGIAQVVLIGAGATAFMDAWLLLLKRLGVPTNNFALVGRWIGHLAQGRFAHASAVMHALNASIITAPLFVVVLSAIYGLLSGYFAARAMNLVKQTQSVQPEPMP